MTAIRTPRALSLLVAAALAASTPLLLAGCGMIPNPVEGVVEGVVEGATGGDIDLGGGTVPEDFPSEVPLVDGEIVFGGGLGNGTEKIWNVTIRVASDVSAQIADDFAAAGFTEAGAGDFGAGTTMIFEKDGVGAAVVVTEDSEGGGFLANYTVSRTAS